jgi:hypothetical protein
MKKKFLLLSVVVLTALCFCLSACADRADGENGGSDGDGTNNGGTDTPYYTIAVYDGGDKTINTFADGTEIKITADSEKNEVFVCWLSDGDFYSFESTTTVSVDKNAVFSAVYANCGTVTLDYGGGTSDSELTAVTAYGRTAVYTEGTLYEGFGYVLPVPSKRNYTFDGWFSADGTAYTDNGGASVGNFGGGALSLVAVYTENPYVTLILENGADGARKVLKQYLGETAVTVTADEVTDYQCTGWTDADGESGFRRNAARNRPFGKKSRRDLRLHRGLPRSVQAYRYRRPRRRRVRDERHRDNRLFGAYRKSVRYVDHGRFGGRTAYSRRL